MVKPPSSSLIDRTRITAVLDKYHAELVAIPKDQFIAVTVPRDRVQALTEHILDNMSAYEPVLGTMFLPAVREEHVARLRRLPERAQAFYAADLLAEEAYTPAEETAGCASQKPISRSCQAGSREPKTDLAILSGRIARAENRSRDPGEQAARARN